MKKTALIFPGQGSQSVGMGKEFFDVSKGAQEVFEIANASLDVDIKDLCFSGPVEELSKTEITQPAILTASIAVLRGIREECELDAAYVAGHSLGEYTALVCAGVLELSDAIKLVSNRGRFMQESVPEGLGAMSAVIGLDNDMVIEECRKASTGDEQVVAANLNSPGQVVISGNAVAVSRAAVLLKHAGAKRVLPLPVSVPSHSPLMESAAVKLKEELESTTLGEFKVPLVSNVEALATVDKNEVIELLTRQLVSPVRWVEVIQRLKSEGVELIVEIGPGKVLSGLVKRIDKEIKTLSVQVPGDIEALKEVLGQ